MPISRAHEGLDDAILDGYGFMEPARPPDPGRSFSALELACPACEAAPGDRCTGPQICRSRIAAALELARSGELESTGPALKHRPCVACAENTLKGRALPCKPAHQCARVLSDRRCRYARAPGSDLCDHHILFAGPRAYANPDDPEPEPEKRELKGRDKKLTEADRENIRRRFGEGAKMADLARAHNVTHAAIRYVLRNSAG